MTTPNIEELIADLRLNGEFCPDEVIYAAADALQSQAERIKELEEECEVERLRLAACGVAALGYFDGCKDEYKSASLEDVLRLNEKCDNLRADVERKSDAIQRLWKERDTLRAELGDLPESQAEMLAEIKQLRAQLAEIEKAEPVFFVNKYDMNLWREYPQFCDAVNIYKSQQSNLTPLFTRPMPAQSAEHCLWARNGHEPCSHVKPEPAQDVNAELVEALEGLMHKDGGEPAFVKARTALANAKGAK